MVSKLIPLAKIYFKHARNNEDRIYSARKIRATDREVRAERRILSLLAQLDNIRQNLPFLEIQHSHTDFRLLSLNLTFFSIMLTHGYAIIVKHCKLEQSSKIIFSCTHRKKIENLDKHDTFHDCIMMLIEF